jgi:hypothetical protein
MRCCRTTFAVDIDDGHRYRRELSLSSPADCDLRGDVLRDAREQIHVSITFNESDQKGRTNAGQARSFPIE